MIIRKFEAETEEAAIMLAKEELGKDAIVMNIKVSKPKGIQKFFRKAQVEITAAIDDTPVYNTGEELLSKIKEMQGQEEEKKATEKKEKEDGKHSLAIEDRLDSLQQMLEQQIITDKQLNVEEQKETDMKTQNEKVEVEEESKTEACLRLVKNQLMNNEVEAQYADMIVNEIRSTIKKDTAIDQILASIYQKIVLKLGQTNTIQINEGANKYIFFIGPTGVGKTTTIAKIASNLKLQQKAKVALITSDTYRIAAVEQLRTYANILSVPLKVVYTKEEMKQAKEEFKAYDVVLVDTAGRSHKNEEQTADIDDLLQSVPEEERDVYLVLSATTKYRDLVKITETYAQFTKYSLIFTKLDETCCIGNILNIKMLTNASLSYSTSGQTVPDDIETINPQKIAKQLLGGQ